MPHDTPPEGVTMSVRNPVPVPARPIEFPARTRTKKSQVDSAGLEAALKSRVQGEVRFDAGARGVYAVDSSNYRQVPIGAVIPRVIDDVVATVATCREFGAPVLSRGGGTSLAGQCCNVAVVMDWSKYLGHILNIDPDKREATVEPGCVLDNLRNAAGKYGLTFGPDPATHNHCTLGGMLGNNYCGVHAQMAGAVSNNTEALEILTYDGLRMWVGWTNDDEMRSIAAQGGRQGEIMSRILSLRDRYAEQIKAKYPPIPRRISGYNLDQLLPDKDGRFNIARALVGSEGTLVTVLEAKCRLIDAKAERVVLMLGYPDIYEAGDHVMELDAFNPTALEGIDDTLYRNIRKKGGPDKQYLDMLPEGKGWLLAEFGADKRDDALQIVHEVMDKLKAQPNAPSMKLFTDKDDMEHIWKVRESGLGVTAFIPGEPDTWEGWEDSAVPPEKLSGYLRELRVLYNKH